MYSWSMEVEWDEARNQTNIRKHGIGFDTARRIFEGTVIRLISARPASRKGRRVYHERTLR